jgi:hypothetical protein
MRWKTSVLKHFDFHFIIYKLTNSKKRKSFISNEKEDQIQNHESLASDKRQQRRYSMPFRKVKKYNQKRIS